MLLRVPNTTNQKLLIMDFWVALNQQYKDDDYDVLGSPIHSPMQRNVASSTSRSKLREMDWKTPIVVTGDTSEPNSFKEYINDSYLFIKSLKQISLKEFTDKNGKTHSDLTTRVYGLLRYFHGIKLTICDPRFARRRRSYRRLIIILIWTLHKLPLSNQNAPDKSQPITNHLPRMLALMLELTILGIFCALFFGQERIERLLGKKTEEKKDFVSLVPPNKDPKIESPRKPLPTVPTPEKVVGKKWLIEETPKPQVVKFDPTTMQIDKSAPSFSDRKRSIHETLMKQSNVNTYQKPLFAKKPPKETVKPLVSEKEILESMISYEKDFLTRLDTLEKVFLPFFKTTPPNPEINQLYDCCKRMSQAVMDLKPIHVRLVAKLESGELDMFGKDSNDFPTYIKYLRGHKGLRLFLNVLMTKSVACTKFVDTFNKLSKSKVTFEEICTLPALEISKYYKFYQEWVLIRTRDAKVIKEGIDNVKAFLDENSSTIQDIFQQGKILSIQSLLAIPDISQVLYTGTARRCRANTYVWDGVLEIQRQNSYTKCQVFAFDTLLIISESEISGTKNGNFYCLIFRISTNQNWRI
jgi:hypothetical protein